jgi:spore coat protein U-like protein
MSPALRKALLVGVGAVMAGLPLSQAAAATALTTFSVTAVVVTTCSITTTNMDFGNYSGVQLDSTATLNTTCSTGTPYSIGLSAGTAPTATVTTRAMTGTVGAEVLNYTLSQDAGHTINWGNTPGTDTPAPVTGVGTAQAVTVFGRIPAGQFPQAGEYSDTITVTLTF